MATKTNVENRVAILEDEVLGKDHPQGSHIDWKLSEVKSKLNQVDRETTEHYWDQGRELNELKKRIDSLEEEVLREGAARRKADLKIAELEKKIAKEMEERVYDGYDRIGLDKNVESRIAKLERTE